MHNVLYTQCLDIEIVETEANVVRRTSTEYSHACYHVRKLLAHRLRFYCISNHDKGLFAHFITFLLQPLHFTQPSRWVAFELRYAWISRPFRKFANDLARPSRSPPRSSLNDTTRSSLSTSRPTREYATKSRSLPLSDFETRYAHKQFGTESCQETNS